MRDCLLCGRVLSHSAYLVCRACLQGLRQRCARNYLAAIEIVDVLLQVYFDSPVYQQRLSTWRRQQRAQRLDAHHANRVFNAYWRREHTA